MSDSTVPLSRCMSSIAAMPDGVLYADDAVLDALGLAYSYRADESGGLAVQSAARLSVQAEDLHHADDLAWDRSALVEAVAVQPFRLVPLHELDLDLQVLVDDAVDLPLQVVALLRGEVLVMGDVQPASSTALVSAGLPDVVARTCPARTR